MSRHRAVTAQDGGIRPPQLGERTLGATDPEGGYCQGCDSVCVNGCRAGQGLTAALGEGLICTVLWMDGWMDGWMGGWLGYA